MNPPLRVYRKLLGQGIASCSLEELQEIDSQLQRSLGKVRERKVHILHHYLIGI